MSSVKRSNMAPSELGQPKAPDKWDARTTTTTMTTTTAATATSNVSDVLAESSSKSHTQQQQKDAPKPSTSTQQDTKEISNYDEEKLRSLLEEAVSYGRLPKDRENKSEMFKELLHNVELEDQDSDRCPYYLSSRSDRGGNRHHTHGGSLQDLVESVNNEQLLDSDYYMSGRQRRLQPNNSRYKKYSSVSSRQREGGSLPSNVNVSSSNVDSFFHEYNRSTLKTTHCKLERNIVSSAAGSGHNAQRSTASVDSSVNFSIGRGDDQSQQTHENTTKISHTVINIGEDDADETRHLLAHDSLAQGIAEPLSGDEGTELVSIKKPRNTTMSYTPKNMNMEISVGEPSRQMHNIERPVQFGLVNKCSSSQLNDSVQLANRMPIKGCTEIKAAASQNGKYAYSNPTQFDENGNTLPTLSSSLPTSLHSKSGKQKRINKAERNTKNVLAEQIEGHRGKEAIETLVAFIENTETSKKPNIINMNKNVINSDRNAKKKNAAATKKENTKLKKSTSMEELKSSSKIEEEIAQSERAQVSLRQKQMSQKRTSESKSTNAQPSTSAASQQSNKRGERRSWGTEELSTGQNVDILLASGGQNVNVRVTANSGSNSDYNSKIKKVDGIAASMTTMKQASVESIPTTFEASEFHVVTKKKRAKKRQILEDEASARQQQGMHHSSSSSSSQAHNNRNNGNSHFANSYGHNNSNARNYHQSNNYNDRDVYLNSLTTKDNRRKSTSSVPPSDKSDSSDLDSIRSLPIETTARTSYADIARTANNAAEKSNPSTPSAASVVVANAVAAVDRWPSVCSASGTAVAATNAHLKNTLPGDNLLSPGEKSSSDSEKFVPPQTAAAILQKSLRVPLSEEKSPAIGVNEDISSSSSSSSGSNNKRTPIVSGATPKHSDVLKIPVHTVETSKNQLQKSKSVDSDKYSSMSMDQFPGLEKTIKPQKSHQNFASIAAVVAVATAATTNTTSTNTPPTIAAALSSTLPLQQKQQQVQTKVQSKKTPLQTADPNANLKRPSIPNDVASTVLVPSGRSVSADLSEISSEITAACRLGRDVTTTSETQQLLHNSNVSSGGINETTANSESNFFTPISASSTTKKVKKASTASNHQHNHVPNAGATNRISTNHQHNHNNNNNNGAHRPAVIIFNDNETTNENVSPLLFGDFNDDILQLMKQDDHPSLGHQSGGGGGGGASSSLHSPSGHIGNIVNSTAFDHIDPSTKANQTITSPQSDPGYSSAHSRNAFSTESLAAAAVNAVAAVPTTATNAANINAVATASSADIQKTTQPTIAVVNQQLSTATNSTHTEFSSKQMPTENNNNMNNNNNTNTKKNIIINKKNTINNNNNMNSFNKTSDVASNQSITNLGVIKFSVQSTSDSDKYNNVKNSTTIDDNVNNNSSSSCGGSVVATSISATVAIADSDDDTNSNNTEHKLRVNNINQLHTTNAGVATTTAVIAATAADAEVKNRKEIVRTETNIDRKSFESRNRMETTSLNRRESPSVQHSTNIVCGKDVHVRYVDPPSTISNGANFNHEKIVDFVGLAWEDVLRGAAHYYNGK